MVRSLEIVLNLNSTENAIDLIKYCTLYFDKLRIDSPITIDSVETQSNTPDTKGKYPTIIHFTPYVSEGVKVIENVLIEEGICSNDADCSFGQHSHLAKKLVVQNSDMFFPSDSFTIHKNSMEICHDAEIILDEAKEAISEILSAEDRERIKSVAPAFKNALDVPDSFLVLNLYKGLIDLMLTHIENGDNVITNSQAVNSILLNYYGSSNNLMHSGLNYNYAQIEATKIMLPFVKDAPMDDILEIRHKANDELLELRNHVETTLTSLSAEIIQASYEVIRQKLEQRIIPSVNHFQRKLKGINVATAQDFVKNMANPLYYSPLLTTFFSNIPASVSSSFSLGMISFQTFLQRKSRILEIQNDPLYFTVKIKDHL